MAEERGELPKRLRLGRVLVLSGVFGAVFAVLFHMIGRITGLPHGARVYFMGVIPVITLVSINLLIRSGKAPWLLK